MDSCYQTRLFVETAGGKGKRLPERIMPVLPVMYPIPDPELRLDLGGLHFHVELERMLEHEIVITAIYEPLDCPEGLNQKKRLPYCLTGYPGA